MDGTEFREAVEDAKRSELAQLGSDRLLPALTGEILTARAVLEIAADSEHAAHNTFTQWAQSEDDPDARIAFADVAEQEETHRRRVLDAMEQPYDPNDGGMMHMYLRGRDDTIQRIAAGMVGRPLVSLRSHARIVDFFAECDDPARADLFRDLQDETAAVIDTALPLLEERCESEDDWTRAQMSAEYVIQVAYDDYADACRELDLEPAGE